MTNAKQDLSYEIFSTRWPHESEAERYNKLFQFWYSTWSQTFLELKGQTHFYSDDFDRQDEVTGLVADGQVIGAFIYNWFNLHLDSHRKHSYFRSYPEDAINEIERGGAKSLMTMGNLAVHPDWRKPKTGGLTSDILLGLACKRFLESDADLLIAFTRNDRKVNDLCYRHGARCLFANHQEHNVSVDIIAVTREEAVVSDNPEVLEQIEILWRQRQIFGEQSHIRAKTRHLKVA